MGIETFENLGLCTNTGVYYNEGALLTHTTHGDTFSELIPEDMRNQAKGNYWFGLCLNSMPAYLRVEKVGEDRQYTQMGSISRISPNIDTYDSKHPKVAWGMVAVLAYVMESEEQEYWYQENGEDCAATPYCLRYEEEQRGIAHAKNCEKTKSSNKRKQLDATFEQDFIVQERENIARTKTNMASVPQEVQPYLSKAIADAELYLVGIEVRMSVSDDAEHTEISDGKADNKPEDATGNKPKPMSDEERELVATIFGRGQDGIGLAREYLRIAEMCRTPKEFAEVFNRMIDNYKIKTFVVGFKKAALRWLKLRGLVHDGYKQTTFSKLIRHKTK